MLGTSKDIIGYYKKDINYRSVPLCYNCRNNMGGKCSIIKDYADNVYVDSHFVCDKWEEYDWMEE
jgi:hypothetical protein